MEIKNPLHKADYLAFNNLSYPIIGIKSNYQVFFLNNIARKEYSYTNLDEKDIHNKPKCYELIYGYDRPCGEIGEYCPIGRNNANMDAFILRQNHKGCMCMVGIDHNDGNDIFFETTIDALPIISDIKEILVKDGKMVHVKTYSEEIEKLYFEGNSAKEISKKTGKSMAKVKEIISRL